MQTEQWAITTNRAAPGFEHDKRQAAIASVVDNVCYQNLVTTADWKHRSADYRPARPSPFHGKATRIHRKSCGISLCVRVINIQLIGPSLNTCPGRNPCASPSDHYLSCVSCIRLYDRKSQRRKRGFIRSARLIVPVVQRSPCLIV